MEHKISTECVESSECTKEIEECFGGYALRLESRKGVFFLINVLRKKLVGPACLTK